MTLLKYWIIGDFNNKPKCKFHGQECSASPSLVSLESKDPAEKKSTTTSSSSTSLLLFVVETLGLAPPLLLPTDDDDDAAGAPPVHPAYELLRVGPPAVVVGNERTPPLTKGGY